VGPEDAAALLAVLKRIAVALEKVAASYPARGELAEIRKRYAEAGRR
jgi:hypothetical protein